MQAEGISTPYNCTQQEPLALFCIERYLSITTNLFGLLLFLKVRQKEKKIN